MSGLLVVLPVIWEPTTDICVETTLMDGSASGFTADDLLVVDNSREGWAADRYELRTHRDADGHNLGTSRAWNVGAREVLDRGLDYLVVLSASMRFGPEMHTTWRRQMDTFWGAKIIEATGHSHHLIAIHRSCFEQVGLWDTNLHAYIEAIDWFRRLHLIGWEHDFSNCWVNALSQGVALHAHLISCPADPLLAYYREKWNGDKGSEQFVLPFGSKPIDYFEDVPIPVLAERYGWETWW